MEKLTKQDLKGPDAFISIMHRLSAWAAHHIKAISSVLAAIAVAAVIWAGYGIYKDSKENSAQVKLFAVQKEIKTIEDEFKKAETPPPPEPPKKDKKDKVVKEAPKPEGVKRTGEISKDYRNTLESYKSVISEFPRTQAAVLAALDLGRIYYDYKDYEATVSLLEPQWKKANHPALRGLCLDQLATAYEAKGDCQNAISKWQEIENDKAMSFLLGPSLIKVGLCQEKLKNFDKAEAAYIRAQSLTNDPESSRTAKKYLRFLKAVKSSS